MFGWPLGQKLIILYCNPAIFTFFGFWKAVLCYCCCFCLRKVSFCLTDFSSLLTGFHTSWHKGSVVSFFGRASASMFIVYGSLEVVSLTLVGNFKTRLRRWGICFFELVWLHETIFSSHQSSPYLLLLQENNLDLAILSWWMCRPLVGNWTEETDGWIHV